MYQKKYDRKNEPSEEKTINNNIGGKYKNTIIKNNLNNMNSQNEKSVPNNINQSNSQKSTKEDYRRKKGTFSGIIELTKQLYKDKPKIEKVKEITQKDIIAIILTIIVLLLVGIVLWFIPITNGWIREFLFENPLFNLIGKLFS